MKIIFLPTLICFIALFGTGLTTVDNAQMQVELKRIEDLSRALDSGVPEVLKTSLPCPQINSGYYADLLTAREPEVRELEQAKRAFGLKLARSLDSVALKLQQRAESEERAKQARQMFELADWVKASRGYGNYFLLSRCESLSTVPLAYLTADLTYPLTEISKLRQRITSLDEERTFRVTVLNREAPLPFIEKLNGNDTQQSEQMQLAWNNKWHQMSDFFKLKKIVITKWKREDLSEDLAFFLDDKPAHGSFTTTNIWNLKRHHSLIFGRRDKQIENVDDFILFRAKIGRFPTTPPIWWKSDNSWGTATETAFREASKHLRSEDGGVFPYSTPAMIYEQTQEGRFYDLDTQYTK